MAEHEDEERGEQLLDWIDARADQWAQDVDLVAMVKNVAHVSRLSRRAPNSIREKFIARQEAHIDALIRMAYVEGFMAGDENRKMAEAAKRAANPSLPEGDR